MNDNEKNEPVSKSPFWRFSIKFYGMPGVAAACIAAWSDTLSRVGSLLILPAASAGRFSRLGPNLYARLRFAPDSPLEESGFELPVPLEKIGTARLR